MDTKQDLYMYCLQETHFKPRDTYRLRAWKKMFHTNGNQKKTGVTIPISDKIDFMIKAVTRDKEGHYGMTKGSIQEEVITIVNTYAPKTGTPQNIRQMLTSIRGQVNSNTMIVETSTPQLYQWIDLPDSKLIQKHKPQMTQ